MPRTPRRPAARPTTGEGRAGILHAAISEFAEQGFNGATTAQIARKAKVTQPLVHHHFGSKRKLWDAALAELFTPLREQLLAARTEAESLPRAERLTHLIRTFIQYVGTHPELSRIIRAEGGGSGEAYDALLKTWLRPLIVFFEAELGAAVEDGTVRKLDPQLLFFALVGAATEPFTMPRTAKRTFDLDVGTPAFIERYADLVIGVLLGGLLRRR